MHASAVKALAMLGIGRQQVRTYASDATGSLEVQALERALVSSRARRLLRNGYQDGTSRDQDDREHPVPAQPA